MFDVRKEMGVKSIRWKIEKRALERIGHVIRMKDDRAVKAAALGWMEDLESYDKRRGKRRNTIFYWKKLLQEAGLDYTEEGEMVEDRKMWKGKVMERMKHLERFEESKGKLYSGL